MKCVVLVPACGLFAALALAPLSPTPAAVPVDTTWNVDDLRPGMKGVGRTVMRGTKIETFEAEVLGVLKNTSPGRDMVLCRLAGLGLEKTGVIAGMSGSPIYVDNRLLGAVAFAWTYGKEPIAGVTPFRQMRAYSDGGDKGEPADKEKAVRVGLAEPVRAGGRRYDAVTVAGGFDAPPPRDDDGLYMVPLRTPLAATGLTPHALGLLRDRLGGTGLVPVQGGGATAHVTDAAQNVVLEPGSSLTLAMLTGDFDLSGVGTVTHVEGDRVYGWGHPFMGLGRCGFPAMTGYIHTVYPRQTVSFKMGSPLKTVGVIDADVSTGIAGWIGRKPDMMPIAATVTRAGAAGRTFRVQAARQRSLLSTLVFTALTNAVDMEGELPEEMTAEMTVRLVAEGRTLVLQDTYSGPLYSGGRAPQALYNGIASLVHQLSVNGYQPVRIDRVEAETTIRPGRRTADVEAIELDADSYRPGETVKATAFLKPYRGARQRVTVALKLPDDLPEGTYTATVGDDPWAVRQDIRDNPSWNNPQNLDQLFASVEAQAQARRTRLALRVPIGATGVAVGGAALPDLPASMVQILGQGRRTGAQTVSRAVTARVETEWVVQGSETVRFSVVKNKRN